MTGGLREIAGARVYVCADQGARLATEQDALDAIGETYGMEVDWLAIPASRLALDFFNLETRVAGLMIQKFTNYQLPVVIFGAIPEPYNGGAALNAFIAEANRGRAVWFLEDLQEFADKLRSGQ